jgi:hypothetical protein
MTKKKKQPGRAVAVQPLSKVPRADLPNVQSMKFCWRVSDIDWDGPWGWSQATGEQLLIDVIPRLHGLESMTWGQVDGPTGSHFVEVTAIVDEAQRRLTEIGKDEQGRLFSLRITGRMRLWGIRDLAILRVGPGALSLPLCQRLKRTQTRWQGFRAAGSSGALFGSGVLRTRDRPTRFGSRLTKKGRPRGRP